MISPHHVCVQSFVPPERRRNVVGKRHDEASTVRKPRRKKRRPNAGSVSESESRKRTDKSNPSPHRKKRARGEVNHKSVHDRAVARALGNITVLEESDFTPQELRSMTTYLRLTPARNDKKRVTKRLRFDAWKLHHAENQSYREQCAQLSVSGVHLHGEDEDIVGQRWPVGTKIRKRFTINGSQKDYVARVESAELIWEVKYTGCTKQDVQDCDARDMFHGRISYIQNNLSKYDNQSLRKALQKNKKKHWPVGTEILHDGMKLASVSGVKTYWRVVYEDNDYEELNATEMKKARILYLEKK